MPESETFKIILQLGSFGLLAIIVIGTMRYAPQLIAAIRKLGDDHTRAVELINEANKSAAEIQAISHEKAIETLVKDCREERRELIQRLMAETRKP